MERSYERADARIYDYAEFLVPPGTKRVEVGCSWVDHDEEGGVPATDLGEIQRRIEDAGGLFGIAHPTIFPGPVFRSQCRGCEFELSALSTGTSWTRSRS